MRIIGYTYLADVHCPACTLASIAHPDQCRRSPQDSDRNGIPYNAVDRERNPIYPLHDIDEAATELTHCGTCHEEL